MTFPVRWLAVVTVVCGCGAQAAELDFASAVGTPALVWQTPMTNGKQAFAAADASAADGAVGVLPFRTVALTEITGPAMLLSWADESPDFQLDGVSATSRYVATLSNGGWWAHAQLVPAGRHFAGFANPYSAQNIRIDRVEILPQPGSLDELFGLPQGTATAGGSGWEMTPMLNQGVFAARTRVTAATPAWFDIAVTGPAEIAFEMPNNGGWRSLQLSVDGKPTARWGAEDSWNFFKIEVPGGAHVVRFLAVPPDTYNDSEPLDLTISALRIAPVAATDSLISALDGGLPVSVKGKWQATDVVRPDGGGSSAISVALQTGFVGPGYLDFRWYDDGSNRWGGMKGGSGYSSRRFPYDAGPGWRDERVWFPPGPQWAEWSAYGENLDRVALDAVRFTPAPVLALNEVFSSTVWENDLGTPWTAARKDNGGAIVSPDVGRGETSRLAARFSGPGFLSFRWNNIGALYGPAEFRLGGKTISWLGQSQPDEFRPMVRVFVAGSQPVMGEWIVRTVGTAREKSRIEIDSVQWQPLAEIGLAQALDAGGAVRWTTSAGQPFTGRADAGAVGGSSAYAALPPGESAWLEAVVEGSGHFDFWLRDAGDTRLGWEIWKYWALTIDGRPVAISGAAWPAQFIAGNGPHRVRLTLRNPSDSALDWVASAVDAVSWVPLRVAHLATAAGLPGQVWFSDPARPSLGFYSGGRNGVPAIFLPLGGGNATWAGIDVDGPCELSWDSTLEGSDWQSSAALRVDAVDVMPLDPHDWQRMRLIVPAGRHSVRWVVAPSLYRDETAPTAFSAWRLSGFVRTGGLSGLADALDFADLFALEMGDVGGSRVTLDSDDAWQPGEGATLAIFDPRQSGKLSTTWGRDAAASGAWEFLDHAGRFHFLATDAGGWRENAEWIEPGSYVKWKFSPQENLAVPLLKRLKLAGGTVVPAGVAMDSQQSVDASGWLGLPDLLAKRGQNSAWSLVNNPADAHAASTVVTGPAQVRYWWKSAGAGALTLSLDGADLPVAAAIGEWTEVEFAVNPGPHEIRWNHVGKPETTLEKSGEAFLDDLRISPSAPLTLAGALTRDPAISAESVTATPAALPWHPVTYRSADGTWVRAARGVAGSGSLRVAVTGPVVLEFRGMAFPDVPPERSQNGRSVVIIGNPGDSNRSLGHFLAVSVDGAATLQIPATAAWTAGAVHVPAGNHAVTFRLQTLKVSFFGEFMTDATDESLQGWLADLRLISPAARYAAWAADLPPALAAAGADADGDGAQNFLEYAFGTDPRNPASRPPLLEIGNVVDRWRIAYRAVIVPALPAHVSGVLQSSADLKTWTTEAVPLRAATNLPVPTDAPRRFYRLWISDGASAPE